MSKTDDFIAELSAKNQQLKEQLAEARRERDELRDVVTAAQKLRIAFDEEHDELRAKCATLEGSLKRNVRIGARQMAHVVYQKWTTLIKLIPQKSLGVFVSHCMEEWHKRNGEEKRRDGGEGDDR